MSNSSHETESASLAEAMNLGPRLLNLGWLSQFVKHHRVTILVIAGIGVVLSLPYQFRPGGKAEVLSVDKQQVQAQVSGRITEILPVVSSQEMIPTGTVIARLETPELQAQLSKVEEEMVAQRAIQGAATAELNRLLNTPRPEAVTVATTAVEIPKEELRLAENQLTTLTARSVFSTSEADRFQLLYDKGAVSLQQLEDTRRQADIEAENVNSQLIVIETRRLQVEAAKAQLNAVLSGPPPEDIQAAREQVAAAEASIQVLEEEKRYLNDQIRRAELTMPFDGLLTTSDLKTKTGSYLYQGDTFAEAEVTRGDSIFVRVQVPEVVVDQLTIQSAAEIKLLAYPNAPIRGQVAVIQPSAKTKEGVERQAARSGDVLVERESQAGRVVEVLVEVTDPHSRLKPGMTGYAKIEGEKMPVIVAFSRAFVRFIKIEIWSWLP